MIFQNTVAVKQKRQSTKRAPGAEDSAAISSSFLRLIIFPIGRRPAARPSASQRKLLGAQHFLKQG
jgi:hypothetical protein